jgi:hypothetical protein
MLCKTFCAAADGKLGSACAIEPEAVRLSFQVRPPLTKPHHSLSSSDPPHLRCACWLAAPQMVSLLGGGSCSATLCFGRWPV